MAEQTNNNLANNKNSIKKVIDLSDPNVLSRFQQYVRHLTTFDLIQEAYELTKGLPLLIEKMIDFEKNQPEFYKKYQAIIVQASGVALPFLTEAKVKEIMEKNLVELLDIKDLNLLEKLVSKRVRIFMHEDRDIFKRELRLALTKNEQLITKKMITIDGEQKRPTVANWIKDYSSQLGAGPVDKLKMADYLFKSPNIHNLDKNEKERVEKLFNIFESLKLSSMTPEGLEEAVSFDIMGERRILTGGKLETLKEDRAGGKAVSSKPALKPKVKVVPELVVVTEAVKKTPDPLAEEILAAYQGDKVFREEVESAESHLRDVVKQDNKKLRAEFYKAVQNKKVYLSIAAFRLLAEFDDMGNFIKEDEKLRKYLRQVWIKKFGPAKIKDFDNDPATRELVQFFIRHILEERLGVPPTDAARVGAQIANIFKRKGKEEYQKLAYYDVSEKRFKWMED